MFGLSRRAEGEPSEGGPTETLAARTKRSRDFPYCTCCLVFIVLVCHSMVLVGNLKTARTLSVLGDSTNGWSNVGLALGEALGTELDGLMGNLTERLTQSLVQINTVQEQMDEVLMSIGQDVDDESASLVAAPNFPDINSTTMSPAKIKQKVIAYMNDLKEKIDVLIDMLRPALEQIGVWIVSFGDQVQGAVEGFSVTIDKVQKIFDQLMAQFAPVIRDSPELEYETYHLFDVDGDGAISAADLRNVSAFYGVEALQGQKASDLVQAHDVNGDSVIDESEFQGLVTDESLPGVMAIVLRQYSKLLSAIAGNVEAARLRDEVAHAVVDYFSLVVAKNMSKVGWVSDRLTNGSLPMAFTADILKDLALEIDNPNKKTLKDVGLTVITEMMHLNSTYTLEAVRLMSDPAFWESEGFDPDDQPQCIEAVTAWTTAAGRASRKHTSFVHTRLREIFEVDASGSGGELELLELRVSDWGKLAREEVVYRKQVHMAEKVRLAALRQQQLISSETSATLFRELLGGRAAQMSVDPETAMAVNSGVPAVPETLEFAKFLAWNASDTADRFQRLCFDTSGTSSNPLQSFANQMKGMANKFTNVLKVMRKYSSKTGLEQLQQDFDGFVDNATDDVLAVVDQTHGTSLLEAGVRDGDFVTGVWFKISGLLTALEVILPSVIGNLKFARREVSAVSTSMISIFGTLSLKGQPLFDNFAEIYQTLWISYFVSLALMTLLLLVYAFWAGGFLSCSADETKDDAAYVEPQTFRQRCYSCCCSCCSCLRGCEDTGLCFWSVILAAELIALILFVVAIVLCVLAGVKVFVASSCSGVYILGDTTICSGMLLKLQDWLHSFLAEGSSIDVVCTSESLTTCELIEKKMMASTMLTICGSIPAALLTFQMIIEAGVLHERARWRKLINQHLEEGS